jgi:hypothetical protein
MDSQGINIFVIGQSGTGKSPIANRISEAKELQLIKASEYFIESFKGYSEDRNEFIRLISQFSAEKLSEDPYVNINYIKEKIYNKPFVIEGIRNPIDFTNLFKFGKDKVIFLNYIDNKLSKSNFESGLDIILSIINWSKNIGIMSNEDFIQIDFNTFFGKDSLEEKINSLIGSL